MTKLKKGDWAPKEVNMVVGIPKDSKTRGKLEKISAKLNRPYPNVYQKWLVEFKKTEKNSPDSDVKPMELVIDTTVMSPSRIDSIEMTSLRKALDIVVPQLEARRGNIPISSNLVHTAKKHLAEKYPDKIFIFSAIRGNKKMFRIFRKQ